MSAGRQLGPYLIERELGRGAMGVVYQARHRELGRQVALKVMLAQEAGSPEARLRFAREAQTAAQLRHPNIVTVFEHGRAGGYDYLALELVSGESLAARLRRDGPLEPREAARVTRELAEALACAHQRGILHRDIKPDNVLLDPSGRPRLTDFGLGKDLRAEQDRLTRTGQMLGTPHFMPPEQTGGEVAAMGPHSDIYSLGATLFALLCGRPPFEGASVMNVLKQVLSDAPPRPSSLRAEIDPTLERICLRCLAKEPAGRYPSAAALAEALERYLAGEVEAPRRLAGLLSGVVLLVLIAAGAAVALRGDAAPSDQPAPTPSATPRRAPTPTPTPVGPRARWVRQEPAAAALPPGRYRHAAAYAPGLGVVVHGGSDWTRCLGDTWAWDGTRWTALAREGLPRVFHAMAYDEARETLVLYGGADTHLSKNLTGRTLADVREWDGEGWRGRYGLGPGPGPLFGHAMVYDPDRRAVLLFGGGHPAGRAGVWKPRNELWALDERAWSRLDPPGAPPARVQTALALDRARRRVVLFSGSANTPHYWQAPFLLDLHELGARGWEQRASLPGPKPRRGAGLAWAGDRVLLFGGLAAGERLNDLWSWDGERWEELRLPPQAPRPAPRVGQAFVYDRARRVLVLFAGSPDHKVVDAETWELRLE